MKRVLFSMVTLFLVLGCNQGLVRVASGASPSYFRLDSNFTTNAERSVAQEESTYINTNDCANWIGTFLHGSYGLPVGWENDNASQLVRNLVSAGIGTVLTGDHHPDAGGLISHDAAQAAYFSGYSSYSNRLDQHLVEAGGSQEFLLAYQWNDDKTGNVFSHVALYVGGGNVIAHGATSDGTFATEGNLQAQAWDWYLNPIDQQTDWQMAIIALSSGPLRPARARTPAPSVGWTVDLSADQTTLAPGGVVTLTARANQALNGTGASLDIVDTTDNVLVASCVSGATCTSQVTVDSATTLSYVAQIGSNAQSDPLTVTWAVAQPIIDWSITLSSDQTDVQAGTPVNLTAEANTDVGPTPDSIEIVDQTSGTVVASCGSGTTCTAQVALTGTTDTFVASVTDQSNNNLAQSDPVSVTWESDAGSAGGTVNLGAVDLNSYCQSQGYTQASLDGGTADDWHCDDSSGNLIGIDMNAACQWQYSDSNATAVMGDLNDPNSWSCQDVYANS